jgi:hypothetical protein
VELSELTERAGMLESASAAGDSKGTLGHFQPQVGADID